MRSDTPISNYGTDFQCTQSYACKPKSKMFPFSLKWTSKKKKHDVIANSNISLIDPNDSLNISEIGVKLSTKEVDQMDEKQNCCLQNGGTERCQMPMLSEGVHDVAPSRDVITQSLVEDTRKSSNRLTYYLSNKETRSNLMQYSMLEATMNQFDDSSIDGQRTFSVDQMSPLIEHILGHLRSFIESEKKYICSLGFALEVTLQMCMLFLMKWNFYSSMI